MRAYLAVIAVTATTLFYGCGSERDDLVGTAHSFLDALASGNGRLACDQLTGVARRKVASAAMPSGTPSCEAVLRDIAANLDNEERDRLRGTRVRVTSVSEESGRVKIGSRTLPARKVQGDWKLDDLP